MPTLYCPSCGSEDIVQKTKPNGHVYWYCNNCGAREFTPMQIPDFAPEPAPEATNASQDVPQ